MLTNTGKITINKDSYLELPEELEFLNTHYGYYVTLPTNKNSHSLKCEITLNDIFVNEETAIMFPHYQLDKELIKSGLSTKKTYNIHQAKYLIKKHCDENFSERNVLEACIDNSFNAYLNNGIFCDVAEKESTIRSIFDIKDAISQNIIDSNYKYPYEGITRMAKNHVGYENFDENQPWEKHTVKNLRDGGTIKFNDNYKILIIQPSLNEYILGSGYVKEVVNTKTEITIKDLLFIEEELIEFVKKHKNKVGSRQVTKVPTQPEQIMGMPMILKRQVKKPDYKFWLKKAEWTIEEAVLLLCEKEPRDAKPYDHPDSFSKEGELSTLLYSAVNHGDLANGSEGRQLQFCTYEPEKYITWAIKNDIPIPEALKNSFKQTPRPSSKTQTLTEKKYVFKQKGDAWIIKYENIEINIEDRHGFYYINELLHKPKTPIHCNILWQIKHKQTTDTLSSTEAQQHLNNDTDNNACSFDDEFSQPTMDVKTQKEVSEKLEDLRARKLEAEKNKEDTTEIEDEIKKLEQYLNANINIHGKIRLTKDQNEIKRKVVQKAIDTAKKNIKKYCCKNKFDNKLFCHLDKNIKTGTDCIYTSEIEWG